jgi:hypothetical protein
MKPSRAIEQATIPCYVTKLPIWNLSYGNMDLDRVFTYLFMYFLMMLSVDYMVSNDRKIRELLVLKDFE